MSESQIPAPIDVDQLFIGLDVGDRRIGIAVSDPTGSLARPLEVYHRQDPAVDVQHIYALAEEYGARGVVVGFPINMNGTEGPQAEKTRLFADALQEQGLRISLWDERLSTIEATRRRDEQRRRRRNASQWIDDEAAALILQNYLDYARTRGSSG